MTNPIQLNEISDAEFEYLLELEEQWRAQIPRLSDKELLAIFPEAKAVIPEKIKEWREVRDGFVETLKKRLAVIKHSGADESSKWFWREWIKVTEGEKLLEIDSQLKRLDRLLQTARGRPPKGMITPEQIQQAKAVPLESLVGGLKKHGKTWIGLCPLHKEKHPSFCVYPDTNRFWCYGQCSDGGDSIKFVRLSQGCSFREAVRYLIGQPN